MNFTILKTGGLSRNDLGTDGIWTLDFYISKILAAALGARC